MKVTDYRCKQSVNQQCFNMMWWSAVILAMNIQVITPNNYTKHCKVYATEINRHAVVMIIPRSIVS